MKRSTAIGRLGDVANALDRAKHWPHANVTAAYVYGALLDGAHDLEWVELAFVVDEPAAVVPWLSRPAHLEAMARLLRFNKLALAWRWRPVEWPVWNHQITRAACFWTVDSGRDQSVFDALTARPTDPVHIIEPADAGALRAQVAIERAAARAHLAEVTAMFDDREWRRDHTGDGDYPEHTLWAAAAAFIELDDWLSPPSS
ncbi:MAG: hypothetical protein AAB131_09090 [Actinomycetota bacterium]